MSYILSNLECAPGCSSVVRVLQDMASWTRDGIAGLQSVVLYSLPELDGAIDSIPLGGLVNNDIYLVPERVDRLAARIKKWVKLRQTTPEVSCCTSIGSTFLAVWPGLVTAEYLLEVKRRSNPAFVQRRSHSQSPLIRDKGNSSGMPQYRPSLPSFGKQKALAIHFVTLMFLLMPGDLQ